MFLRATRSSGAKAHDKAQPQPRSTSEHEEELRKIVTMAIGRIKDPVRLRRLAREAYSKGLLSNREALHFGAIRVVRRKLRVRRER